MPGEFVVPGVRGALSLESSEYMRRPRLICLRFPAQAVRLAFSLAFRRVGNNKAARIAMIAMTTITSSSVNPASPLECFVMSIRQGGAARITRPDSIIGRSGKARASDSEATPPNQTQEYRENEWREGCLPEEVEG